MRVYVGVSVEDTKVVAILFDVYGKKLNMTDFERRPGVPLEAVEDDIVGMIAKLVESEIFELQTVGVGVDEYDFSGIAVEVTVGNAFENTPLAEKIKKRFGCGVVINSNVNCSVYGAYKYFDTLDKNVIGIFAGDHVGGALIINGELYMGKYGASELGHITLVPDGAACKCGNYGCLEAYASKDAIQKYIKQQCRGGRTSIVGESASRNRPMMMKAIYNATQRGDEIAIEAVNRAFKFIALTYSNLTNLVRPDAVIFGGELFDYFGPKYLEFINRYATQIGSQRYNSNVKVLISELGNISAVYGAYQFALHADIGCI
ncbi:MAG: ROK family protein [Bacillota bacterium]|nr:ROK family protein [Bacillota bacterium]